MKKIEVTIHNSKVYVEAFGFDPLEFSTEGLPACQAATRELEDLLGDVEQREKKNEYFAEQCGIQKQFCG